MGQLNAAQLVKTVVHAAVGNGLVPSGETDFIKDRGNTHLIVVVAAPRTGSTFLTNVLCELTGLPYFLLCSAYSTNEHDLYLPALCIINSTGCVSQMHMKGTFHNAALLRSFGIKPIFLVRRIYDIVVSLLHDLRKKEQLQGYGTGLNGYSFIWQDKSTRKLDDDELLDLIIDLIIPWYINFYVSWHRLCEQGAVDAIWITYETIMGNKRQTLQDILDFLGVKSVSSITDEILSKRYKTFNVGRVGRGDEMLSNAQKTRIKRLFSYYSDIDFGKYAI